MPHALTEGLPLATSREGWFGLIDRAVRFRAFIIGATSQAEQDNAPNSGYYRWILRHRVLIRRVCDYLNTVTSAVSTLPTARPRMNVAMSTARVARNRRLARAVSRSKSSTMVDAVARSGHRTTPRSPSPCEGITDSTGSRVRSSRSICWMIGRVPTSRAACDTSWIRGSRWTRTHSGSAPRIARSPPSTSASEETR